MPSFETTRHVPYTPSQMFDLVADVEQYPRFFPLCEAMRVRTRERKGETEILVASMDIGYKAIRETVTTRVTLDRRSLAVRVDFVDGPFRVLENRWRFAEAKTGGTDVRFFISYEFKSFMLQMLVGTLFDQAFRRCVTAFEARAREIYGRGAPQGAIPVA
ncbi:MAG: type II toxin-antitoxin system RatA family toxin [Hyphomicrobiaceae bacterium]|nr:type II toxin-antitoxin system RatA family toxin [Hyphomicrobiaceae bacterium]